MTRFDGEVGLPLCTDCESPMDQDEADEGDGRCSGCREYETGPRAACPDCGMGHATEDVDRCIEGHGEP